MTTAREIVRRALLRLHVIDVLHPVSAEEAATGLAYLNDMMAQWPANGVDTLSPSFALDDTFVFFVPPRLLDSHTMESLTYAGTWNAATNTPTLANGSGIEGTVYRVGTQGTTALDGIASWSANEFVVLGRTASDTNSPTLTWQKGLSSARHHFGVIAMLAMSLSDDFGKAPSQQLADDANDAWRTLLSDFQKVPYATFDPGLTRLPSRRWPYSVPSSST
jgi:hypothetical protein